jgi:methyl-accepting chemotaxis protein
MNKKRSLKNKIVLLSIFFILTFMFSIAYFAFQIRGTTFAERRHDAQNVVDTAFSIIVHYEDSYRKGEMTLDEAQKKVLLVIKNLHYSGQNYFWINDTSPKMIMDPVKPELDGTDLSRYQDSKGKYVFMEMANICKEHEGGFVVYWWPKPGSDIPIKKISYVKLFKPWNWIIGSGVYVDDMLVETKSLRYTLGGFFVLLSTFIFFLFYRFFHSVSRPINAVTKGLSSIGANLISASKQVSSASQMLAQATSEQAASLEETSSSLEEMSSMTKNNADNATQADNLMKDANQVVAEAHKSMTDLTASMNEISKSSQDTSRIIKTIDEIAFQTNLLALNAAVEAARAGESGRGFAVVAEEVRNLAKRAAEASKSTADLIENTVKTINEGSEIMIRTNNSFMGVIKKAAHATQLVNEIASASKEQAQGIEQISRVVADMDKIVQQNAANAEESSSASQELEAESQYLKKFINDLKSVVKGVAETTSEPDNQGESFVNKKYASGAESIDTLWSTHRPPQRKKLNKAKDETFKYIDESDFKDF